MAANRIWLATTTVSLAAWQKFVRTPSGSSPSCLEAPMRLILETGGEEPKKGEQSKWRVVWRHLVRVVVVAFVLATIWLVAGSIAYPLFWFEFIFKSGFHNEALWAFGFD